MRTSTHYSLLFRFRVLIDTIRAESLAFSQSILRNHENIRRSAKRPCRAYFGLCHTIWWAKVTSSQFLANHCYTHSMNCRCQEPEPLPGHSVHQHSNRQATTVEEEDFGGSRHVFARGVLPSARADKKFHLQLHLPFVFTFNQVNNVLKLLLLPVTHLLEDLVRYSQMKPFGRWLLISFGMPYFSDVLKICWPFGRCRTISLVRLVKD